MYINKDIYVQASNKYCKIEIVHSKIKKYKVRKYTVYK